MMSPIDRMRKRYDEDATLHAFVDCARSVFRDLQLTPTEMREAVVFACFLEEMRNPSPMTFHIHQDFRDEIDVGGYRTNARAVNPMTPKRKRTLVFRDDRHSSETLSTSILVCAQAIWMKTGGIEALLMIEEPEESRLRIRLLSTCPLSENTVNAAREAAKEGVPAGVDLRVSQYEM